MSKFHGRIRFGNSRYRGCTPEVLEIRLNLSPLFVGEIEHDSDDHDDDDREYESDEYEADEYEADEYEADEYEADEYEADEYEANEYEANEYEADQVDDTSSDDSYESITPVVSSPAAETYSEDHGDFEESPEFEELESLIEDAHETGTDVELEDHHHELVDEVISHLAGEMLVPTEDFHALIVNPAPESPAEETIDVTVSESSEETVVDQSPDSATESDSAVEQSAIGAMPETEGDDGNSEEGETRQGEATIEDSESRAASEGDEAVDADSVMPGVVVSDGDSTTDVEKTGSKELGVSEGVDLELVTAAEMKAAGFGELPTPGLGIRFGSPLGLVNGGIRLPFELGAEFPVNRADAVSSVIPSSSGGTTFLVTAALASGLLAAANADRSPAIQKIARRIRKSFRPAM